MPQWIMLLIGSLATLVITVIGAVVGAWLARKRLHAEKWWELKTEAYSKIIEALHHAAYCNTQWYDEDITHEGFSEEKKKQLADDFRNANREIEKATGIGAFIISDDAAKVLSELAARPQDFDYQKEPWFELFAAESQAYKNALGKMRVLAKKDLELK
jgi:hypothetical protein